jgi:hypothetical protein
MTSFASYSLNGTNNPSTLGGAGTGIKYFGPAIQSLVGKLPTIPTPTNASGQMVLPGNGVLADQNCQIIAVGGFGNDTGDPSGTVKISVSLNTGSEVSPSYTVLGDTGDFVPSTQPGNWALLFTLFADASAGTLSGTFMAFQNGLLTNSTPKSATTISDLDFSAGIPAGLVCGATFGTSDQSNTAALYQFEIGVVS